VISVSSDPKKVVNLERLRDGSVDPLRALSHDPGTPGAEPEDNLDRLVSDFLEQINTVTAGYEARGKSKTEDLDLLLASLTETEETAAPDLARPEPVPEPARLEPVPDVSDMENLADATATRWSEVSAPPRVAPSQADLDREILRTLEELEDFEKPGRAPELSFAASASPAIPAPAVLPEPVAIPYAEAARDLEPASASHAGMGEPFRAYATPGLSVEGKAASRRVLFLLLVAVLLLTLAVTLYYLGVVMKPEASLQAQPPEIASQPKVAPPAAQPEEATRAPETTTPGLKTPARADSAPGRKPERRPPSREQSSERRSSATGNAAGAPPATAPLDRTELAAQVLAQQPEVLIPPRRPEQPAARELEPEPFQPSSSAIPDPARASTVGQLSPRPTSVPASPVTSPLSSGAGSRTNVAGLPTPATVISRVLPTYPEVARRVGLKGRVDLDIEIDEQGRVTVASPVGGPEVFHGAAISAVRRWRFKPATMNGVAVSSQGRVSVLFDNPR
jgi:TonB family protein